MSMPKSHTSTSYFDDTTKSPRATELHDILVEQFKAQPGPGPNSLVSAGPPVQSRDVRAIFPKDACTADVVPSLMLQPPGTFLVIHPLTDDKSRITQRRASGSEDPSKC